VSDRLRDAYLGSLGDGAGAGSDCADAARIWAAARGEVPAAEAQALVDHALNCPSCAMAWRLAREVAAATVPAPVKTGWGWAHWAAVAAAVVAGLLIPVGVHEWRAPEPAVYREPGGWIQPLVSEGQALARDEFRLRWSAGPSGTRYSVRVARIDLAIVAQADALDREEYLVPASALQELPAGTVLYWRVEAHLPDGSHVASDMFSARLE
jgi:hypothetical protein